MRNISMFIFNFNYIKDLARITMDDKCNGIYCEAETDRYKIAENSYNLLMPNDVFNSKTYTIFVFIISIMIFIYYYRMLDLYNYTDGGFTFNTTLYFLIHVFLLTILLWMIIYRYTPNDEQGYKNYFKIKWNDKAGNYDTIRIVAITIISCLIVLTVFSLILLLFPNFTYIKYINNKFFNMNMNNRIFILIISGLLIGPISYIIANNDKTFDIIYGLLISLILLCVLLIKRDALKKEIKCIIIIIPTLCFIASIILVIYLMNIVMTFRNNTTPILKTKPLTWSLRNSLNNHLDYRITAKAATAAAANAAAKATTATEAAEAVAAVDADEAVKKGIAVTKGVTTEYTKINTCANSLGNNISSVLDIYIAFEELSKIVYNSLTIPAYTTKLKDTINKSKIYGASDETYNTPTLSLIFDKKVSIPSDYGDIITKDYADNYNKDKSEDKKVVVDSRSIKNPEFSSSHEYNSNDRNTSYLYTADISYDNANLFYEKYWDMKDTDDEFLRRYNYGLPVFLKNFLLSGKPNLTKLLISVGGFVVVFVVIVFIVIGITGLISRNWNWDLLFASIKILAPFIAFVVFVTYIIVFIRFNTNFNKNVVYKCLDCSYKRSLNKLNTIVTPYIRMYDNKITGGNKNYTHHYIIANVFYSILSGNINLLDAAPTIVSSVKVTAGGSGYTSAPAVVFTPSGASATAFLGTGVDVDKVVSINVTNGGSYTTTVPNITFTATNGSGAVASANITGENIDSISINDNDDIDYKIYNSMSKKLADMNMNILTNENLYREYYNTKFKDLYNTKNKEDIENIYKVFTCVFGYVSGGSITDIENYFKTNIIKRSLISKIYLIIKRCIKLFEEELKNKPEILKYFKFYKNKGELIPHKFILILKNKTDYNAFIKDVTTDFDNILENKLNIAKGSTDMTNILIDITDEDSTNQNKDIQSKCIIKIIAKYLLIMGHINYNRIDYIIKPSLSATKFSIDTLGLYKLISNVSYADTFVIDDTFGKDSNNINLLTAHPNYSKLTYMYNYLDTKFVNLSSNNNKNYLINIIKSINNTLNNDNKTIDLDDIKESRYLFSGKIKEIAPELPYENEEEILNNAHYISTTSFESTYFINMFIILFYIVGTVFIKIK